MQDFKRLNVRRKSHLLSWKTYNIKKTFQNVEKSGLVSQRLVSQIRRSCSSIPTSIAEGSGRNNSKDLIKFLQISMGSASETEYQLTLPKKLKYVEKNLHKLNKTKNRQLITAN